MIMHFTEFFTFKERQGRIYVARKGTITVVVLDDGSKHWINNRGITQVFSDKLVDSYWIHAIDCAGSFANYLVNGLAYDPEDKPFYPKAEPMIPITEAQILKLSQLLTQA